MLTSKTRSLAIRALIVALPVLCVSVTLSSGARADDGPTPATARVYQHLLDRFERPVLYLDVDCVVARHPARVDELFAAQVDFAIFNWLAEEHPEALGECQGRALTIDHFVDAELDDVL